MRETLSVLSLLLGALIVNAIHPIKVQTSWIDDGIKHEAENAFKNVKQQVACNVDGVVMSGFYATLSSESYIIFSVNIPNDGVYPVTLHAHSCSSVNTFVDIQVNGRPLCFRSDLRLADDITTHELTLRAGLNTIYYKIYGGSVAFDFISIKGGIPNAVRGATLPFEEIEAESAIYQGTLIGPGRQFYTLPSEASGRQAVQFTKQGDFVEFSPTQPFSGMVVRFSIPDSPSGSGQDAKLNLIVNGNQLAVLNVSSYYSWVYGSYPYSKNPSDGNPHHFYDEIRYYFGSTAYPAGTKVRLQGGSAISYTIDLADFYNVPAPYPIPANFLSVVDYGADPSGLKDSFDSFNSAISAAASANKSVWIPEGNFSLSNRITVNQITISGAGPWFSVLQGNDFGFFGNESPNPSTGIGLYDFAIYGRTRRRVDSEISQGVGGSMTDSVVQNIWVEHNKCGIWVDGPNDSLLITGVTIRNTFADGINLHQGITNTIVEQSTIRNTGDDCLAMWPQQPGNYENNVFRFNTASIPCLANTIAIYGGQNNSATDNLCMDTVVVGAGLSAGTRFGSVPLSGTTTYSRNTLIRTGSPDPDPQSRGYGSIWMVADSGNIDTPIIFDDIIITDSYYQAISFFEGQVSNTNFTNIQINGANYAWEERVQGTIYASNVVAQNLTQGGIWNCGVQFVINQGPGNNGWDTTECA